MNITQLIKELEAIREQTGDVPVRVYNYEWNDYDDIAKIEAEPDNNDKPHVCILIEE